MFSMHYDTNAFPPNFSAEEGPSWMMPDHQETFDYNEYLTSLAADYMSTRLLTRQERLDFVDGEGASDWDIGTQVLAHYSISKREVPLEDIADAVREYRSVNAKLDQKDLLTDV